MLQAKWIIGVLITVSMLVVSGCATTRVNQAALSNLKKVGLCAVTMDKMGQPSANNQAITQKAADYALKQYDQALSSITSFQYIPRQQYQSHASLRSITDFKNSPVMKKMLEKNAGQAAASAMMLRLMGKKGGSTEEVLINTFKDDYVKKTGNQLAARGCANVTYHLFRDDAEGVTVKKVSYGNAAKNNKNKMKQVMLDSVAYACQQTGLDGMFVVWNKAAAFKHVKGVNVVNIKTRRTNGTIRLNPTLMLIDKNGEIVADLGWPGFDDLSPTKGSIPIMVVVPKDPKKANRRNLKLKDLKTTNEVDLKDSKGYAYKALRGLIDETSVKLVTKFRKTIGEIE
ncbi:hypothetical protein K8S19_05080 [bacterium]|nr:hypothetical protein [bacterium]